MTEGTVKFFNAQKHFGFIAGDDGKEYFVHSSGLSEGVSITEGDKVSFEAVEGDRGLKAEKIKKVSGDSEESSENAEDKSGDDSGDAEESSDEDSGDSEEKAA